MGKEFKEEEEDDGWKEWEGWDWIINKGSDRLIEWIEWIVKFGEGRVVVFWELVRILPSSHCSGGLSRLGDQLYLRLPPSIINLIRIMRIPFICQVKATWPSDPPRRFLQIDRPAKLKNSSAWCNFHWNSQNEDTSNLKSFYVSSSSVSYKLRKNFGSSRSHAYGDSEYPHRWDTKTILCVRCHQNHLYKLLPKLLGYHVQSLLV